jgi:hypothetical protein
VKGKGNLRDPGLDGMVIFKMDLQEVGGFQIPEGRDVPRTT